MNRIRIGVIYPTDPVGSVIGGVDSFIRGLIKYAPDDVEYVVFGATTDADTRSVRHWSDCVLGDRRYQFFPLMQMSGSGRQPRVPATLTFELRAILRPVDLDCCDILESHRIEHLLFKGGKPINLFLHQNMAVLKQDNTDIRWRFAPKLYKGMERRILHKVSSVFCVREDAVKSYREAYPSISDKFRFQSTWMDPELFFPEKASARSELRDSLSAKMMVSGSKKWLIAVGRLDYQKDPLLMIRALKIVLKVRPDTHLIWVGEGVLKRKVLETVKLLGLSDNVTLTGLLKPDQVANMYRAADMFVMSSAYEGMPIALIEAMACGLPSVTTDVGEVRRLVIPGVNGETCPAGDNDALAQAIVNGMGALKRYSGTPCVQSASRYTPQKVLEPIYENYRYLTGLISGAAHDI